MKRFEFDNSTAFSELSISKAPELRCSGGKFTTCGQCEGCELGSRLTYTKEWFPRCAEQTKRQFVFGLVHRFNSPDLMEYINALLKTLEGKDFTYARSRNRPSLKEDMPASSSNHALDKWQVSKNMYECLNWFESRRYWTKCNFMLGLMQMCNTQLLQIMGSESRGFQLLNDEQDLHEMQSKEVVEQVFNKNISQASVAATVIRNELQKKKWKDQQDSNCYEGSSLKVNFDSLYHSSSSQSQDNDHLMPNQRQKSSTPQRPRSSLRDPSEKRSQELKSTLGVSFSGTEEIWDSGAQLFVQGRPKSSSSSKLRKQSKQNYEESSTEDLRGVSDGELSDALDDDYISVDPSSVTDLFISSSWLSVQRHKDFVRCLPVHLSKLVLSYLDTASLTNCLCISKHWRILAEEVQQDAFVHQVMIEEVMMMQGATAKGLNPKYAKKLLVCVPKYEDEIKSDEKGIEEHPPFTETSACCRSRNGEIHFRSMAYCYEGVETVQVEMEERNLFCGAYNVFVLQDSKDPNRCTTYNGGHLVVCGSSDRRVRLLDAATGRSEKNIKGHAGSVKCLYISEKRGIVLSGSYDTSVRCWDIRQGKCKCIFRGHRGTVLCVALSGNNLATGSRDNSVKVWNFETGRCRRTFRHHHVVLTIDVSESIVVSGCEGCKIKVWEIESATLVKTLEGHQSPISGVAFNKYHIISSSSDCYALAWSAIGKHKKCLQAFRHPKEVLCVKLMYCRVITGAADGKLRVWNLLNGDCLRMIRGNSKNDVITSLYIADNRIVLNTLSNLLVLNFEPVSLNYNLPPDRPEALGNLNNYSKCPPRRRPRSYVRAQKQARGAHVENLTSGPALSSPSFSGYLDRSVSMTPLGTRALRSSRISSAPANVTRHISQSISHHVQRLSRAREPKPRPHSSPANFRQRIKDHEEPESPDTSIPLASENVLVKDIVRPTHKPEPLPGKQGWHGATRGRSAPAIRTEVLPSNERGWTTSMKDVEGAPHNKLMPTAAQSRDYVKRRLKSACVVPRSHCETSGGPLRRVSCLNLRTYSAEAHRQQLLEKEEKNEKESRRTRALDKPKVQRPVSCITY